jgi:hypothetical protein
MKKKLVFTRYLYINNHRQQFMIFTEKKLYRCLNEMEYCPKAFRVRIKGEDNLFKECIITFYANKEHTEYKSIHIKVREFELYSKVFQEPFLFARKDYQINEMTTVQ